MKKVMLLVFVLALIVAANVGLQKVLAADCADTYDSFGKKFMETYCTNCHASTKTGFSRFGAPKNYDFDKPELIAKEKKDIIEWTVVKKRMPPGNNKPSAEELTKLKNWLECEYQ